jgi:hypothetical protein
MRGRAPAAWLLLAGAACGRIGFEDRLASRAEPSAEGGQLDGSSSGANLPDGSRGERAFEAGGPTFEAGEADSGSASPDADSGSEAVADAMDGAACSVPQVADYCATLPFLPAPPVIDGMPDCAIALQTLTPVDWTGGASPPDATAEYAVAWRADGLYFFVRVHDPSLVPAEPSEFSYAGDGVELFMDSDGVYAAPPAYDTPGTKQFTIAAPGDAQSSVARAQVWYPGTPGPPAWTSSAFRAFGTPDGYVVEAFVSAGDLGLSNLTLAAGGTVGMDLSIDVSYPTDQGPDAGGAGNRLGQYFLHIADADAGGGLPPFDPRAFCVPILDPQ